MKRWLRLVLAVVVVGGLVVVLFVVRNRPDEAMDLAESEAPAAADERVTLLDISREDVQRITVNRGGSTIEYLPVGEGLFEPAYEFDVAFSTARINRVVGSATSLRSSRLIDGGDESLDEFGLAEPALTVTVDSGAEDVQVLQVGNRVPGGAGYYVKTPESPAVYTVSTTWISPFFYNLDDLRDKELPVVNGQTLQEIEIATLEGRDIRVVAKSDDRDEFSLAQWLVVEPFQRDYDVSSNWLDDLFTALAEVEIVRFVDDDPGDLSLYELDPPVASFRVVDENAEIAMVVGAETEGGRFARLQSGGPVFIASGTDAITDVTPYRTVSGFAFIVSIDLVDRIRVDTEDAVYTARLERTPAEDPDDDPIETFYFNGEEMDEDLFRDLYQWMIGLLFDAEITGEPSGEPVMEITYSLNTGDPDVTLSFVPFDNNFHAVVRDGLAEFVVTRSKISRLAAALADPESIRDD